MRLCVVSVSGILCFCSVCPGTGPYREGIKNTHKPGTAQIDVFLWKAGRYYDTNTSPTHTHMWTPLPLCIHTHRHAHKEAHDTLTSFRPCVVFRVKESHSLHDTYSRGLRPMGFSGCDAVTSPWVPWCNSLLQQEIKAYGFLRVWRCDITLGPMMQ